MKIQTSHSLQPQCICMWLNDFEPFFIFVPNIEPVLDRWENAQVFSSYYFSRFVGNLALSGNFEGLWKKTLKIGFIIMRKNEDEDYIFAQNDDLNT